MNKLMQLKTMTTVVVDTGDVASVAAFKPKDATTNPSLILKASMDPQYQAYVEDAIAFARKKSALKPLQLAWALKKLSVNFGVALLQLIPGRVSTEVDPALSFDRKATIKAAHDLIDLYVAEGVDPKRVLIKIAATWEGIQAAAVLEQEGIHCNLTLIFHFAQALICADHGITLVSPFVGRIYDWYKKAEERDFLGVGDPGVQSVRKIYHYFRKFDYATIVMGASFRNLGQIEALAGCDYLTISPVLLQALQNDSGELVQVLSPAESKQQDLNREAFNEAEFRFALNADAMTTEKLSEGIRLFCADSAQLAQKIISWL